MIGAMVDREAVTVGQLAGDERQAWADYLRVTRNLIGDRYASVEPHAWQRLRTRLAAIASRRKTAGLE